MRTPILALVLLCACSVDDRVLSVSAPATPSGDAGSRAASTEEGAGLLPGRVLTVDVEAIDFGDCVRGQTLTRPLRVRNAGDTTASGVRVALDGAPQQAFEVDASGCAGGLGPGADCAVNVTFTPDVVGPLTATLVVTLPSAQELRVTLSGVGLTSGSLTSSAAQLDFGTVEVGSPTPPQSWVVRNASGVITGPLSLTNSDPRSFETATDCGAPLPPGGSCNVSARFLAPVRSTSFAPVTLTDGTSSTRTVLSAVAAPRITITIVGSGRVTTNPPVVCDGGCSFLAEGIVTLLATPENGSSALFSGWGSSATSDPGCSGLGRECRPTLDTSETFTVTFSPQEQNLIFVSSERFPADLGSSTAYDAECNRLATEGGINDAAGAGYVAVVSGPESFLERVPAAARGWVRMDGLPVADTLQSLVDGAPAPFYPINLNERGTLNLNSVWSGTRAGGAAADTCANWTSREAGSSGSIGLSNSVDWLGVRGTICNQEFPVFCLGVTKTAPVVLQTFVGKRLWVTPTVVTLGTDTVDAACQASRPSGVATAVAFIGYTDRPAADVLDPTANYVRPDGARLGTGEDVRRLRLFTGPRVASDGSVIRSVDGPWTGGLPGNAALSTENCNDWQDSMGIGISGDPAETDDSAFRSSSTSCSQPRRIYCVEQ